MAHYGAAHTGGLPPAHVVVNNNNNQRNAQPVLTPPVQQASSSSFIYTNAILAPSNPTFPASSSSYRQQPAYTDVMMGSTQRIPASSLITPSHRSETALTTLGSQSSPTLTTSMSSPNFRVPNMNAPSSYGHAPPTPMHTVRSASASFAAGAAASSSASSLMFYPRQSAPASSHNPPPPSLASSSFIPDPSQPAIQPSPSLGSILHSTSSRRPADETENGAGPSFRNKRAKKSTDSANSKKDSKDSDPSASKTKDAAGNVTMFQCCGFGDCRMVFTRSEHLARHVRKHTGERPFRCHCGKAFSRLDNLRQHAQTVHADMPERNEIMMQELTALHTSLAQSAAQVQHAQAQILGKSNAPAVLIASHNHTGRRAKGGAKTSTSVKTTAASPSSALINPTTHLSQQGRNGAVPTPSLPPSSSSSSPSPSTLTDKRMVSLVRVKQEPGQSNSLDSNATSFGPTHHLPSSFTPPSSGFVRQHAAHLSSGSSAPPPFHSIHPHRSLSGEGGGYPSSSAFPTLSHQVPTSSEYGTPTGIHMAATSTAVIGNGEYTSFYGSPPNNEGMDTTGGFTSLQNGAPDDSRYGKPSQFYGNDVNRRPSSGFYGPNGFTNGPEGFTATGANFRKSNSSMPRDGFGPSDMDWHRRSKTEDGVGSRHLEESLSGSHYSHHTADSIPAPVFSDPFWKRENGSFGDNLTQISPSYYNHHADVLSMGYNNKSSYESTLSAHLHMRTPTLKKRVSAWHVSPPPSREGPRGSTDAGALSNLPLPGSSHGRPPPSSHGNRPMTPHDRPVLPPLSSLTPNVSRPGTAIAGSRPGSVAGLFPSFTPACLPGIDQHLIATSAELRDEEEKQSHLQRPYTSPSSGLGMGTLNGSASLSEKSLLRPLLLRAPGRASFCVPVSDIEASHVQDRALSSVSERDLNRRPLTSGAAFGSKLRPLSRGGSIARGLPSLSSTLASLDCGQNGSTGGGGGGSFVGGRTSPETPQRDMATRSKSISHAAPGIGLSDQQANESAQVRTSPSNNPSPFMFQPPPLPREPGNSHPVGLVGRRSLDRPGSMAGSEWRRPSSSSIALHPQSNRLGSSGGGGGVTNGPFGMTSDTGSRPGSRGRNASNEFTLPPLKAALIGGSGVSLLPLSIQRSSLKGTEAEDGRDDRLERKSISWSRPLTSGDTPARRFGTNLDDRDRRHIDDLDSNNRRTSSVTLVSSSNSSDSIVQRPSTSANTISNRLESSLRRLNCETSTNHGSTQVDQVSQPLKLIEKCPNPLTLSYSSKPTEPLLSQQV